MVDSFGMMSLFYSKIDIELLSGLLDTKFNEHGGLDRLNLDKYSLKEVLGFNILGKMFEGGWDKTTKEGKIAQCSDFCGGKNIVDQIYTTTGNENERYDYLKDRWKERQDERRQN